MFIRNTIAKASMALSELMNIPAANTATLPEYCR